MGITSRSSIDGRELTIYVEGRFDFGVHQAFRNAYEDVLVQPKHYVVDLAGAIYIDSSALGMLLLRDHGGGDQAQIRLLNCRPDVRKVLTIANFEQLFQLG